MGVHESQSLLWERMVALSLPFSRYLAPKLTAAFPQLTNLQVGTPTKHFSAGEFCRTAHKEPFSSDALLRCPHAHDVCSGSHDFAPPLSLTCFPSKAVYEAAMWGHMLFAWEKLRVER